MTTYVIRHIRHRDLVWSNHDGWVTSNPDTFTFRERQEYNLPMEGSWVNTRVKRTDDVEEVP